MVRVRRPGRHYDRRSISDGRAEAVPALGLGEAAHGLAEALERQRWFVDALDEVGDVREARDRAAAL
ncbi:MAG: hypothetical protein U1F43_35025 [Myxococcota bacterium]